jgi:hypothetical protein
MVGLSVCDCGVATTDVKLIIVQNMIDKTSPKKKKKLNKAESKLLLFIGNHTS